MEVVYEIDEIKEMTQYIKDMAGEGYTVTVRARFDDEQRVTGYLVGLHK